MLYDLMRYQKLDTGDQFPFTNRILLSGSFSTQGAYRQVKMKRRTRESRRFPAVREERVPRPPLRFNRLGLKGVSLIQVIHGVVG